MRILILSLLALLPLGAHHSFTMFDMTKKIPVTGKVTAFQWTNPHAYIEIDTVDEQGAPKHWSVELGSPSILQRSGWKFSTLKPGDTVNLIINPLKTGDGGGFLFKATLSDGRVLGNGPAQQP